MKTLFRILFLILLVTQICFAQWYYQYPLITQSNLNDVTLVDNFGWAVGDEGTIIKTTNNGIDWVKQESSLTTNLSSVCFIDGNRGWAVGDSGTILYTKNAGVTWVKHTTGTFINLRSVFFVNMNIGWIVGGNQYVWGLDSTILLKTTNGGQSWFQQISSTTMHLLDVSFVDESTGWVVGELYIGPSELPPLVLKTTNGGTDWFPQPVPDPYYCWLNDVCFVDSNNGWVIGSQIQWQFSTNIWRTTNGGTTWINQTPEGLESLHGLCFTDPSNGWIVGRGNNQYNYEPIILRTTNGGTQWKIQSQGSPYQIISAVCFLNNNTGIAVGSSGKVLSTTDGGDNWLSPPGRCTANLNAVHFFGNNIGWAVGDYGTILKTTNEGTVWELQTSGTKIHLNDILFINEFNGWIVGGSMPGDGNILLHTTNAGVNWTKTIVDSTLSLSSVFFLNENIGWIGGSIDTEDGYSPIILKTIDGGANWLLKFIAASYTLTLNNDVYFINADIGFAVGGDLSMGGPYGSIHKTTDGGETWINQMDAYCNYQSIGFVDEQNGIAVGWGGWDRPKPSIYYTSNGGVNWHSFNADGSNMNSVAYLAQDCAWVVGGEYWTEGKILFSSNGGIDWSNQGVFSSGLNSVSFINSSTGWAVGNNGTILHTTNGGVSFVEEELIDEIPSIYSLSNNFPNPFNPSTKIKYSIPQSSQVQIKIYDVLGNEIETLVNEEKPAGTYEITWYAENLPSGVYFYRLQAGSFVQTRKMILLK